MKKEQFERAEIQNRKIVETIKNVGVAVAMPYVLVVNM